LSKIRVMAQPAKQMWNIFLVTKIATRVSVAQRIRRPPDFVEVAEVAGSLWKPMKIKADFQAKIR
jgi:hypothetical protein